MKKIILITLILLFSFTNISAENEEEDLLKNFNVLSIASSIGEAIIYFDHYDPLDTYTISSNIPIYDISQDEKITEREYTYLYVVYRNEDPILTVYVHGNSAKISDDFIKQLKDVDSYNNKVLVCSYGNNAYLYSTEMKTLIDSANESSNVTSSFDSLLSKAKKSSLEKILVPSQYLQPPSTNSQTILNYPLVAQNPYPNGCWAACIASISNYYKSTSYTSTNVVQACLGNNLAANQVPSLTLTCIQDLLNTGYHIETAFSDQSTTLSNYKSNLNNNKVYIIAWAATGYGGHVTMLYGYSERGNNTSDFYIMDPQYNGSITSGARKYMLVQLSSSSFPTNNKIANNITYYYSNSLLYLYWY